MEIAVAAASPLGQYLAELDAEEGGKSMAQLLTAARPATTKRPTTPRASSPCGWRQLLGLLHRRVELLALRRLVPQLRAFHPTIREELQQAPGTGAVVFAEQRGVDGCWWWRKFAIVELLRGAQGITEETRKLVAAAGGALVVLLAALLLARWESAVALMGWSFTVVGLLVTGLELSVRGLLACYAQRSRTLMESLSAFDSALGRFNETYDDSLSLVKRAELASRGYRLGAGLLPPIGRLEAANAEDSGDGGEETAGPPVAKHQLRCLPLRRKLRAVNDGLQAETTAFSQGGERKNIPGARSTEKQVSDCADAQSPSLLLTALTKQHNRGVLLLESAMRSVLVRNVARACCSRTADCSLFGTLASHRAAVDGLVESLNSWTIDLNAWNTTSNPTKLVSSPPEPNILERQDVASSDEGDVRLKKIAMKLQELRSMSETLTALTIAAQHEVVSGDSVVERLVDSRAAMRAMAQHVQEAWDGYDSALSTLRGEDGTNPGTSGDAAEEGEDPEANPTAAVVAVPTPDDPSYTVIFTGTSTGDEGFDLQALLKQQEADASAASSPTPHFVSELRDVLAHRQARGLPGLTKQVNHDQPSLATAGSEAPAPPPSDAMFSLPRAPPRGRPRRQPPALLDPPKENERTAPAANAFNSELQALLQRAQPIQQQDILESLGDSDSSEEEVSTLPSRFSTDA